MMKLLFVLLLFSASVWAAPGSHRVSFTSKHFQYSVDQADASVMGTLAPLAEQIYEKLRIQTGYTPPEAMTIIVRNEDDYTNGYAVPFAQWVSVWLTPMDFEFRGGTRWLGNVLAHELGHVFTMRALGYTSHWLGHIEYLEMDKTYSSARVEMEWTSHDLESWLAEGLAQYSAEISGYDTWDAHRDMLERVAWHSGNLLP